mmetsp:Transcript_9245/g.18854  ORF Transcript_9245/g.18854 Transcript_9245/m.18854 type:complete len:205 (-) Transcript_9245:817-1431(-)
MDDTEGGCGRELSPIGRAGEPLKILTQKRVGGRARAHDGVSDDDARVADGVAIRRFLHGGQDGEIRVVGAVEELECKANGFLASEDGEQQRAVVAPRLLLITQLLLGRLRRARRLGGRRGLRCALSCGLALRCNRLGGRRRGGHRRGRLGGQQVEERLEEELRRVLDQVKGDLEGHQQVIPRAAEQAVEDHDDGGRVVQVGQAA